MSGPFALTAVVNFHLLPRGFTVGLISLADALDFKQRLVDKPPRDRSGPRTSDRFVFQQDWALCRLMSLHGTTQDYVITFDHH
jgi:Cap4-like dsDNA endonuclease family protein